jgi:hypothetical protein
MYRRDQGEVLRSEVVGNCVVQERCVAVGYAAPGAVVLRPVTQCVVTWGEPTEDGYYDGDIALTWRSACAKAGRRA